MLYSKRSILIKPLKPSGRNRGRVMRVEICGVIAERACCRRVEGYVGNSKTDFGEKENHLYTFPNPISQPPSPSIPTYSFPKLQNPSKQSSSLTTIPQVTWLTASEHWGGRVTARGAVVFAREIISRTGPVRRSRSRSNSIYTRLAFCFSEIICEIARSFCG